MKKNGVDVSLATIYKVAFLFLKKHFSSKKISKETYKLVQAKMATQEFLVLVSVLQFSHVHENNHLKM